MDKSSVLDATETIKKGSWKLEWFGYYEKMRPRTGTEERELAIIQFVECTDAIQVVGLC